MFRDYRNSQPAEEPRGHPNAEIMASVIHDNPQRTPGLGPPPKASSLNEKRRTPRPLGHSLLLPPALPATRWKIRLRRAADRKLYTPDDIVIKIEGLPKIVSGLWVGGPKKRQSFWVSGGEAAPSGWSLRPGRPLPATRREHRLSPSIRESEGERPSCP